MTPALRLARFVPLLSMLAAALPAQSPKRPLSHADYDGWKSLQGTAIRDDGAWVAVTIAPQEGDKELLVKEVAGAREWRQPRGRDARFTASGAHLLFLIDPPFAEVRKRKLDKLRASEAKEAEAKEGETKPAGEAAAPATAPPAAPRGARGRRGGGGPGAGSSGDDDELKPSLGILTVATGELRVIERVKSFRVVDEGPSIAVCLLEKPLPKRAPAKPDAKPEPEPGAAESEAKTAPPAEPQPSGAAAKPAAKPPADPGIKRLQDGTDLVILDLRDGTEQRIPDVLDYGLLRKRAILWWNAQSKRTDPAPAAGLFARDLTTSRVTPLVAGPQQVRGVTTDRESTRLAFFSNAADWRAEKPRDAAYVWDFAADQAECIAAADRGLPPGRMPSVEFGLRFCEDGGMLLLGAGELPEPELPKQLPEDKVALDLWHWRDPLLQPMQQKRQGQLRSRGIPIVYSFAERRLRVLGDSEIDPPSFATRDGSRLLVHDQDRYQVELSWDTSYHDVLLLNTFDGKRETLVERLRGRATASPGGRFVCWFDAERDWHAYELATQQTHCLSRGIETGVVNELHDQPSPAGGYGIGGWTEADRSVLVYDRYDVFEVVPGGAVTCVTDGYGRAEQIVLRYVRTDPDPDERFVPADRPLLLSAVAETTRASGYYTDRLGAVERPRRLVMLDKSFGGLQIPKQEPKRRFFTLATFRDFPDLWTAGEEFGEITRLTRANPQQDSIRWGDAELVRWKSLDGRELSGVLIKPEGFDPARRHPLLVHIYERLSQGLHSYRAPGPGTSPNASWYVSNGYLWFMPDITYEVGHPGDSALKCVVPGVHHLIAQGFVDPERIGISGHSWGGYQTAYLVTRTSLFRAAEAGAPVANMTSAYGGIRWSTGMSRMFQYEQTQSRIGASLWHAPWLFIENSPLFELDRVVTPLLILHNDQDGAVPWYQGIELFTALRRLGKEAYLFNYVGEDHGLRRRANQLDWTVRMAEFFDHHLRGRPAPRWMRDGVPFDYREREKLDRIAPQPAEAAGGTGAAAAAEAAK